MRLKHHSHGLKNQYCGKFPLFRDQGVGGSNPLSPTIHSTLLQVIENASSKLSANALPGRNEKDESSNNRHVDEIESLFMMRLPEGA